MDESLYCWEGWESPFSSIQVLTLVADGVLDTKSPPNGRRGTGGSARFQSGSGGGWRGLMGPGMTAGTRATGTLMAQNSSVSGPSLCSVSEPKFASFFEPKSSSSQTKPSPSQVPVVGGQLSLSISACQVDCHSVSLLRWGRDPPTRTDGPHLSRL